MASGAPIQCRWNHESLPIMSAEATLQRPQRQPVVQGDETVTGMSVKQGPKSEFGGKAKRYGEVHKALRDLFVSSVR